MNFHYNPNLKAKAGELRNNSTKAETRIWNELLKSSKLQGYSFLRQRPILDYVADFFCKELLLVIEIDGWTHEDPLIKGKDKLKTKALQEHGYSVLRFTNYEIVFELEKVEERLLSWIDSRGEIK